MMECLGEKDTGSGADLAWQPYRGTAIPGVWIVSVWVVFLAQAWPPSHADRADHWISKTGGDCLGSLPNKKHFKHMVSSKKKC